MEQKQGSSSLTSKLIKKNYIPKNDLQKTHKFFGRKKLYLLCFFVILFASTTSSILLTEFQIIDMFTSIPKVIAWAFNNLLPDERALSKLPKILDKLIETIFTSIMATMTASLFGLLFAIFGSKTTQINRTTAMIARFIASISRNIPVAAWAMIFLISYGMSSFTGFLALFFYSFGFLTRVFVETIDEASSSSVEALRAGGANYAHVITQAVLPSSLPQILSWILYMVETNIRSATLVGILTGSGIGFMFDVYYKSMQYTSASLVVISIVSVVLLLEVISNYLRRVIL
jgi:phosphonate transport system permease protein